MWREISPTSSVTGAGVNRKELSTGLGEAGKDKCGRGRVGGQVKANEGMAGSEEVNQG